MSMSMSSSITRELIFLVLQFLNEEGFTETAHMLECETGLYFDMDFFEKLVLEGNLEEAETHLSFFTNPMENKYSRKIFFELRKQKFLEALDSKDRVKALDILREDMKVFAPDHKELFEEMTMLLTMDDFREHQSLCKYRDAKTAREMILNELKKVIEANPVLDGKLRFPELQRNRLRRMVNQSLNWQHLQCENPSSNPAVTSLFEEHTCDSSADQSLSQMLESFVAVSMPSDTDGSPPPLMSSESTVSVVVSSSESTIDQAKKIPDTPDGLPQKSLTSELSNNVDLPKKVEYLLFDGSTPATMDFHPLVHTYLLVGTTTGDVKLWDISSGKLFVKHFTVWNLEACSWLFKAALAKDVVVYANCVKWSPDGSLFGVAYSKHMVQLYSYHGCGDAQQHLEIDAHDGSVNDLAFSIPYEKLLVITCGDDKTIKVWEVATGVNVHVFEGHDAPIYSLCPQVKERIHFIFSTSTDGKMKAWLYDNLGARVDYEAPGLGRTRMAYTTDGQRLFSCGTNEDGETFLVEWEPSEGSIKRTYGGFHNNSPNVVHFGITKNQYLAAGDDHTIKIWDMDQVDLLMTIDAGRDIPVNPCICFNKNGTLLAVMANENRIKILATDSALEMMDNSDSESIGLPSIFKKPAFGPTSPVSSSEVSAEHTAPKKDVRPRAGVPAMLRRSKCLQLEVPSYLNVKKFMINKLSRLMYTKSGNYIVALASSGIHLVWKRLKDDQNLGEKGQVWKPMSSHRLMINDLSDNHEEPLNCFAVSRTDSYLISASGPNISLFNLLSSKLMTTIKPRTRRASMVTCLAFFPLDNNVIAIGMADSSILIYNVRLAKVQARLEDHSNIVTGIAFSTVLNVMVSSGADAKMTVWSYYGWKKQASLALQYPPADADTWIQFHQDQTRFLVVQNCLLAIYEAKELACLQKWKPAGLESISQATFSCDSRMVFACFDDGTISVFDAANFLVKYNVISNSLFSASTSNLPVYAIAIASHPGKPNQFLVSLTDGSVVIFEPQEGNWLSDLPDETKSVA